MILLLSALGLAATVDGRVLERSTSRPLAGAEIRVESEGQPPVELRSDADGRFVLDLPDGVTVQLTASTDEHVLQRLDVSTPIAGLRIFLRPLPAEFEVVVESFQDTTHPTVHRVDAEQAYETPGTQDDVVRLTQALPGVTVQREFSPTSGDLSVRGSAPGDNRYYLDGIEIPYLYHFNQYASVFPTTQLEQLSLFPSTFGSRYGDAVGGIVEAESRTDAPDDVQGQLTFNTIIAGADVRAPVGKGWWMAASGRRSYQDLYSQGSDQYTLWPIFHDLAIRAEKGDEDAGTGVFLVSAGDRYARAAGELDVLDPLEAEESPSFTFRRAFQVLGVRHRWQDAGDGRLVVALVHDDLRGDLAQVGRQRQRSLTLASRLDWTRPLADRHRIGVGYELRGGLTDLDVLGAEDVGLLVSTEAPGIGRGADLDDTIPRLEAAVYADAILEVGAVQLLPGARLGLDTLTGAILPEPRLAARWRVADQTSLELAAGRYLQTPAILDLAPGVGDPTLPLTRSWQASAGWEQTFARRLELSVDVYGKRLTDAQIARPDKPPEVFDLGRAYGVEVVTRYRLRETFFLWGWASVARAQVRRPEGWTSAAFDQPVNLGVVASWDPTPQWNFAVRWRYGSGLPWTPVNGGIYDANDDTWQPQLAQAWSARFPAYTKVDLAAAHTISFPRWALTLRAEVWYVPPRANVLYPTWNDDWSEQGFVRGIPLLPLLGARATF